MLKVPPHNIPIPMPKIGDVVMFSYENTNYSNPKIERIRSDINWEEAVHNFRKEDPAHEGVDIYRFVVMN
jgi:hypothetical protein